MSEKDNAVAQEVATAPSLKALHALILDGDLTDAARMCDQLMAEQERIAAQGAIAEIVSASHDDAEFGERSIQFLRDFQHLEYGTKLYAIPSLQGDAE